MLEEDRYYYSDYIERDFVLDVEIKDEIVDQFEKFLQEKTQSNIRFIAYRDEIKYYIKANIAEQLYGTNAYSKVLRHYDNMVNKVLEIEKELNGIVNLKD